MKLFYGIIIIALCASSCSSSIDPSLLAKIEHRTAVTEELFEKYSSLNDQLGEAVKEEDYSYSKLTKSKNNLRAMNNKITRREKIIADMQQNSKKDSTKPTNNTAIIDTHKKRLADYSAQQKQLSQETNKWLAAVKNYTAQAEKLRKPRNLAYNNYTESRLKLKVLKNSATEE